MDKNLVNEALDRIIRDLSLSQEVHVSSRRSSGVELPEQTPGKPFVNAKGAVVPNSVALGGDDLAYRDGQNVVIETRSEITGESHSITIFSDQVKILKRFL